MTEPNEAMKAMARRVAEQRVHPNQASFDQHVETALAAIMETQEAIADFIERDIPVEHDGQVVGRCSGDKLTAARIRAGEHYALAGER